MIWEVWRTQRLAYSTNFKLAILKQGMKDWSGNDEKMTSESSLKLKLSKRCLDMDRDF